MKIFALVSIFWLTFLTAHAEDGYRLWMRYEPIKSEKLLSEYRKHLNQIVIEDPSATLLIAQKELLNGLNGLIGKKLNLTASLSNSGAIILGTPTGSPIIKSLGLNKELKDLNDEGFLIRQQKIGGKDHLVIAANHDIGVLYGTFHLLKILQLHQSIKGLNISSTPKIKLRVLNHWDNLDRTVERGYAGFSLWDWHKLPHFIDQRYIDYARVNASIGINGIVLTNVNANSTVLTKDYLVKAAALADTFRPYGIKVYLTARFSAPIDIGGLDTADPLDPKVQQWWKEKASEIYTIIPDFGGFLVKANSEGQPGPQDYDRSHAEGANMMADALAPFGGIVMWRAFVYDHGDVPVDRTKQAYNEFKPLDGKFIDNVILQVKNGPLDFQPREPFHPLFGAMPDTPLMMEFQITQEYLGQGTHLVYLATMFKEKLDSDTYANGEGTTVAKIIDGSVQKHSLTGIAGIANIGSDRNWTGHHFGQANWYSFGRLAWDHSLTAEEIAEEWSILTFGNEQKVLSNIKAMLLGSYDAIVNYMNPLGLHHINAKGHHYGPAPWIKDMGRADWTSVYYHKASTESIGFDRTATGSDALEQYHPEVRKKFEDINDISEKYLLWFHNVEWTHRMESGRNLWEELCFKYNQGVIDVRQMQTRWQKIEPYIDEERYRHVSEFLTIQEKEAVWWRDACILYFQTFSGMPIPDQIEKPKYDLEHYISLKPKYVPGI